MWVVIIVIFIVFIMLYNQLIREKNSVQNSYATVDVILKKRYELIPNLVETVRGYAKHEEELFKTITMCREKGMETTDIEETLKLGSDTSNRIRDILLVAENYPELKSSQNFLRLQDTLKKLEDELSAARRTYNSAVTEYNISLESFPTNLVGKTFRMQKATLFRVSDVESIDPTINFRR